MTGEAAPPAGDRRLILVGRVAGPFGVRGELRLTAYTAEPAALLRYGRLLGEDGAPALTLTGGRVAKADELIARAAEAPDRTAAEALKGLRLYVPREALPPPEDEDDFYLADLIGLAAETLDGESLGRVKAVLNHGAGDILEVDPGDGRPTVFHAFTREVVPEVRIAEGRLVIAPAVETGEPQPDDPEPDDGDAA